MAGINKSILIGNLGRDPKTSYTQDEKAVTSFSVATSRNWKDKNTGEKREQTEWHRVVTFGKLAEVCQKHLKKGSQVYIEGRIVYNQWTDKDGVDRVSAEIHVREMQMLGKKPASDPKAD